MGVKSAGRRQALGLWDDIEAIARNAALYSVADVLAATRGENGGRPRKYDESVYVLCFALLSEERTAYRVEALLRDRRTWKRIRKLLKKYSPRTPRLPAEPPRRHIIEYWRKKLAAPGAVEVCLGALFEVSAIQATDAGHFGGSSPQGLRLGDVVISDGKVLAARRGVGRRPGKLKKDEMEALLDRARRCDGDVDQHRTGAGENIIGTKFQLLTTNPFLPHASRILGVRPIQKGEMSEGDATVAMIKDLVDIGLDISGLLMDGALHDKQMQPLLRDFGIVSVAPVTAASGGHGSRSGKPRTEKRANLEELEVKGGAKHSAVRLVVDGGHPGMEVKVVGGPPAFLPFENRRLKLRRNSRGDYRLYGYYTLPESEGLGEVEIRLYGNDEDSRRGIKRMEHLRAIPPGDPQYKALYGQRNVIESVNRVLEDTLWLGRAHSDGHRRQLVDLLGFALLVNSRALEVERKADRLRQVSAA